MIGSQVFFWVACINFVVKGDKFFYYDQQKSTMAKSPLKSKTLWVNIIAFIAMLVQTQTGFVIGPEEQISILAVLNVILRFLTREEIIPS